MKIPLQVFSFNPAMGDYRAIRMAEKRLAPLALNAHAANMRAVLQTKTGPDV